MKKLITLLMAIAMMFALVACGSEEPAAETTTETPAVEETTEEATEEATEETTEEATEEATEETTEEATEETTEETTEEYYSQDLVITNSLGFDIYELYIATSEDEEWGEDLLGESIFAADEVLEFTTDVVGTADATWDIKVVDSEGTEVEFYGANFSEATIMDINMGADGATPTVDMIAE